MFYDSKCECVNCKHQFKTTKVNRKAVKVVKTDTDFCTHYEDVNPTYYDVLVCPKCGMAFNKSFKNIPVYLKEELQDKYLSEIIVPNYCGERTIEDAIRATKLAYYAGTLVRERKLVTGNLLLKLAWYYRYLGDEDREMHFLKGAAVELNEALTNERTDDIEQGKLVFLIAELNLRSGNYTLARKWFSMLMTDYRKYGDKYRTLAANRWQDYKYNDEEIEKP